MPKSRQNRPKNAPDRDDELSWKRQLGRGRISIGPNAAETAPVKAAVAGRTAESDDQGGPETWRRQLEHGRLSALAMPQGTEFAGPGAAGGKMSAAAPSAMDITGLVNDAKTLMKIQSRKDWSLKVIQIPWVGWLLAPLGLCGAAAIKSGHDGQQASAAKRLSAAAKKYPVDKLPIPQIKLILFAIKNFRKIQIIEWMSIIGGLIIWLAPLVLLVTIVIMLKNCVSSAPGALDCLLMAVT